MRTHASKPTPIALLLAVTLALPMLSATARADELVMPYSCQMVSGRPLLVASSPQTYRINGHRETRQVTLCSPADPTRCRAWNVHSFTTACGGAEVPWPAIVAGSPPARDGRARLDNGRFLLSMPAAWNLPASDPCAQMDQKDPELDRYCSSRRDLSQSSSVEMPAGFAPTLGLDVKFHTGNSPAAYPSPAASASRPEPGLTAKTPTGGLTWKASPVAPPQPGALQAGVPFDPDQPPQLPKKKLPETKSAARIEPTLKPALPPAEQSAPARSAPLNERPAPTERAAQLPDVRPAPLTGVRPAPVAEPRSEPITPRRAAVEPPVTQPAVAPALAPEITPPPAPVAVAPPAPAPAFKLVEPQAKVAALPQPEPAPLAAPIALPPQSAAPTAPPVLSAPSATSVSTQTTQVAETMTKQEPYSSRPQKLTPPNSGPSLTTILIGAGLALSALGTVVWMRRKRDSDDELLVLPRVHAGPGFSPGFSDDERTVPNLSGPMAADGLHRTATAHTLGPAFGPYGQHIEPAFDDPLGPVLPGEPDDSGNDHPRIEPSFSELDPAHDWATQNLDVSHTLDIPPHDEPRLSKPEASDPAEVEPPHLLPILPEAAAPSDWSGAADWPPELPQTLDDALELLGMGVTATTPHRAMKRIVDGLRHSWHPDHATDDADRAIRELRIRQIDTAWDILTANQHDEQATV
ncbi:MAG: LPXTG cell wall anchor domain-containing protein [Hyphomicrobiaceae bacterium]